VAVDNRNEVRDFLASRRAKITPEQVGLDSYGARRVPGLRRAEVAQLAGVSVEYYTRMERGSLAGVSETVLGALVQALQLDESERAYLFDLARAAGGQDRARQQRRPPRQEVRPSVQRLLDSLDGIPAFVRNGRLDVLATNHLARALYSPVFDSPPRPSAGPMRTSGVPLGGATSRGSPASKPCATSSARAPGYSISDCSMAVPSCWGSSVRR
jgi:transcriptional regulator with XRE-family HTH domain